MRSFIVAAIALLLSQGTATAADWTGFYIGAQAGYLWGQSDHSFSNGAPSDSSDPKGAVYGAHIGYNHQFNTIVVGLEADAEKTGADGSFNNTTGGTSSGSADINWLASVRGRLGYAIDDFLPYVTGGAAWAGYDFGGGPAGGPCCGYSETIVGWTAGGGLEYAISTRFSARLEYRYTDFGQASGPLLPSFPGVTMPVDNKTQVVRLGVSFHF